MKVSEMIKNLQKFMEEHGDLECWYATDDEGNGYQRVYYEPSTYYVDLDDEIYHGEEDLEYFELDLEDVTPVCVVN